MPAGIHFQPPTTVDAPGAAQDGFDRSRLPDREHDDRHTVFAGKRKRGGIHDLEVALDRLLDGVMRSKRLAFGSFFGSAL